MSITQEFTLTCDECSEPIAEGSVYFWGRHGGEWHPKCMAEMRLQCRFVTGMWQNTDTPFREPDEYLLVLRGLEQGAGI